MFSNSGTEKSQCPPSFSGGRRQPTVSADNRQRRPHQVVSNGKSLAVEINNNNPAPKRQVRPLLTPTIAATADNISWCAQFVDFEITLQSSSQSHSHPNGHIEREVVEAQILKHVPHTASTIVDIGGNPRRHSKYSQPRFLQPNRRKVHSCCPVIDAFDEYRDYHNRQASAQFPNFRYCNHYVQACDCNLSIDYYISIHSLYYLTPDIVAELVQTAPLYAAVHRFHRPRGFMFKTPRGHESEYVVDIEKHTVVMVTSGEKSYTHSDMQWLDSYTYSNDKHGMVWSEVWHLNETYVYKFLPTTKLYPKKPIKSYDFMDVMANNGTYSTCIAPGFSDLDKQLGRYRIEGCKIFKFMNDFVLYPFPNSDHFVNLDRRVVHKLINYMAGLPRNQQTFATLSARCKELSKLLPDTEQNDMQIYGVILAFTARAAEEAQLIQAMLHRDGWVMSVVNRSLNFEVITNCFSPLIVLAIAGVFISLLLFNLLVGDQPQNLTSEEIIPFPISFVLFLLVLLLLFLLLFCCAKRRQLRSLCPWKRDRHPQALKVTDDKGGVYDYPVQSPLIDRDEPSIDANDYISAYIPPPYEPLAVQDGSHLVTLANQHVDMSAARGLFTIPETARDYDSVDTTRPLLEKMVDSCVINIPQFSQKPNDGVIGHNKGSSLVGLGNPRNPQVPSLGLTNEIAALNNRVGAYTSPPKPGQWDELFAFVILNIDTLFPCASAVIPLAFEEWLKAFPISRQVKLRNSKKILDAKGGELEDKDFIRHGFVKREKLVEVGGDFDPRWIQSCSDPLNITVAPYVKAIAHQLQQIWHLTFKIVYASGHDALELGDLFYRWDQFQGQDNYWIEDDFSRFDKTISQDALDFEFKIYHSVFHMPKKIIKILRRAELTTFGYGSCGTQYSVDGQRKSGDSNTSVGNSLLNALTHVFAEAQIHHTVDIPLEECTWWHDYSVIVMGDDNVSMIRTDPGVPPNLVALKSIMQDFGFVAKPILRPSLNCVTFCSARCWPIRVRKYDFSPSEQTTGKWAETRVLAPLIGRFVINHGHAIDSSYGLDWLKGVLIGLGTTLSFIPLASDIIAAELLLIGDDVEAIPFTVDASSVIKHTTRTLQFGRRQDIETMFNEIYGLHLPMVEDELRNQLLQIKSLPSILGSETLAHIIDIDCN